MAFLPTNASQVQQFAVALYGIQVGSSTMAAVQADIANVGGLNKALNAYYAASFGSSTTAAVAASVAANLGLTGTAATDAAAYITAVLNGTAASARGEAISGVLSLFSTLTANATFGAAATAWNTKVAAAVAYTGAGDLTLAAGQTVGNVFTLTVSDDELTGTSGDDVFNAKIDFADPANPVDTLSDADIILGGAGKDTLNVTVTADYTVDTTSVETVNVTASDDSTLTLAADVTTVGVNKSADKVVEVVAAGLSTLNVSKSLDVTATDVKSAAVAVNVTVAAGADALIVVTADDATKDQVRTVTVTGETGTGSTLEVTADTATALNLVATGDLDFTLSDAGEVKTATITGNGDVAITLDTDHNKLVTFNASGLTGGVTAVLEGAATSKLVTVNGGSGDNDLDVTNLATAGVITTAAGDDTITTTTVKGTFTINAGAGDDTITINDFVAAKAGVINGGEGNDTIDTSAAEATYNDTGAALSVDAGAGDDLVIAGDIEAAKTTVTFAGGAGIDAIRISGLFGVAEAARVSGFETVDVSGNADATGIDLSRESSFKTVAISTDDNTTDAITFNADAGVSISATSEDSTDSDAGALAFSLADDSGTADELSISLNAIDGDNSESAEGIVTFALTADGIETINIATTAVLDGDDAATLAVEAATKGSEYANALTLAAAEAETLVITGNAALVIDITDAAAITLVDASDNAGGVEIDLTGTTAANFVGGTGGDTVTGNGDSIIDADTGADAITVAGGDTLVYDSINDSKLTLKSDSTALATVATWDVVTDFTTDEDIFDFSAFNFAVGSRVAIKDSAADTLAMAKGTASTTTDFFKDGSVNKFFALVDDGANAWLAVDVNKDGSFQAGTDLVIKLAGVQFADIATTDFVL